MPMISRRLMAVRGTEVTVQNTDIKKISGDEFNTRRYEPEPALEQPEETK